MIEPSFRWPDGFRPGEALLYVRNTRLIAQPAAAIWDTLVRAPDWPSWYPNAANVILPGDAEELRPDMKFRWTQTGVRLDTQVREFEPGRRIAWCARSPLIQAYHAWEIQPDGDACFVVTDETQRGILPRLFRPLLERRMLAIHDRWLADLEKASAWTDDMRIPLPDGKTADDVVDCVLRTGRYGDVGLIEAALRAEFSLREADAALARDRAFGGLVRAATRNEANRPDPKKDPVAWASFERAWADPSILASALPEHLQP